jgi:ataxin-10
MSLLDPEGLKWLSQILGRMDDWLETDDGRFDLATRLIMRLVDRGAQAALFESLSDPDEPITPSQVTLLKLVDASLEPLDRPNPAPSPNAFLLPAWRGLAAYTTASMNSAKDDGRLGAVLAALILATEGLSTIVLAVQTRVDSAKRGAKHIQGGDEAMVSDMKAPPPTGIVPQLVALLGATHAFLPRVKPTKEAPEEPLPFANIKRDLVRLLAALAYDDSAVGDAVRAAQGVELILGMCDTDDRNPYLREYALLCVRNLMKDNPANQAIIAEMDPVGIVGDNGELLPLPERLKKAKAGQAAKETLVEEETV